MLKFIDFGSSNKKQKLIAGRVMQLGIPIARQVRAYSRASGLLLASSYSNKDGYYKMYLPFDSAYFIVSFDESKTFNAVIQDNVVPK